MIATLRGRGRLRTDAEAPEYWITYSDLMVTLLMVFALLLFAALAKMQKDVTTARQIIESNERALRLAGSALRSAGGLSVDSKSGTLTMNSEVLFDYGSATLRPEAVETVRRVATQFLPELLDDSLTSQRLEEIVVEGHTDTVGTYMSNLDLSQRRAFSVMREMVESTSGASYGERVRELIVASGKSEVRPIAANNVYSADRSRRIEIHIRFQNEEVLKRILDTARR